MGQPIIKYRGRLYFFDEKQNQIQNIEDPSDLVLFSDMDMSLIEEA